MYDLFKCNHKYPVSLDEMPAPRCPIRNIQLAETCVRFCDRLHETLSQSYGALLIQRTEMQVLSGGSSSDTSDKERSATDEEQGAAEETNDEEPPTEAA